MTRHPDADDLLGYTAGLLEPATLDELEAHIDDCPACTTQVAVLSKRELALRKAVSRVPVPVPAPWWRRWPALLSVPALAAAAAAIYLLSPQPLPDYALQGAVNTGTMGQPAVGSEGTGCSLDLGQIPARSSVDLVLRSATSAGGRVYARAFGAGGVVGEAVSEDEGGVVRLRLGAAAFTAGPVEIWLGREPAAEGVRGGERQCVASAEVL